MMKASHRRLLKEVLNFLDDEDNFELNPSDSALVRSHVPPRSVVSACRATLKESTFVELLPYEDDTKSISSGSVCDTRTPNNPITCAASRTMLTPRTRNLLRKFRELDNQWSAQKSESRILSQRHGAMLEESTVASPLCCEEHAGHPCSSFPGQKQQHASHTEESTVAIHLYCEQSTVGGCSSISNSTMSRDSVFDRLYKNEKRKNHLTYRRPFYETMSPEAVWERKAKYSRRFDGHKRTEISTTDDFTDADSVMTTDSVFDRLYRNERRKRIPRLHHFGKIGSKEDSWDVPRRLDFDERTTTSTAETSHDSRSGVQLVAHPNGDTYLGALAKDSTYSGFGILMSRSSAGGTKTTYVGEFQHNLRNGYGVLRREKLDQAECFAGEFRNNKIHGFGILAGHDKSFYCGEFVNGAREGLGTLYGQDRTLYIGEWKENILYGTETSTIINHTGE